MQRCIAMSVEISNLKKAVPLKGGQRGMERCLRRRNIYIPKGVPNASEVYFFPRKKFGGGS